MSFKTTSTSKGLLPFAGFELVEELLVFKDLVVTDTPSCNPCAGGAYTVSICVGQFVSINQALTYPCLHSVYTKFFCHDVNR